MDDKNEKPTLDTTLENEIKRTEQNIETLRGQLTSYDLPDDVKGKINSYIDKCGVILESVKLEYVRDNKKINTNISSLYFHNQVDGKHIVLKVKTDVLDKFKCNDDGLKKEKSFAKLKGSLNKSKQKPTLKVHGFPYFINNKKSLGNLTYSKSLISFTSSKDNFQFLNKMLDYLRHIEDLSKRKTDTQIKQFSSAASSDTRICNTFYTNNYIIMSVHNTQNKMVDDNSVLEERLMWTHLEPHRRERGGKNSYNSFMSRDCFDNQKFNCHYNSWNRTPVSQKVFNYYHPERNDYSNPMNQTFDYKCKSFSHPQPSSDYSNRYSSRNHYDQTSTVNQFNSNKTSRNYNIGQHSSRYNQENWNSDSKPVFVHYKAGQNYSDSDKMPSHNPNGSHNLTDDESCYDHADNYHKPNNETPNRYFNNNNNMDYNCTPNRLEYYNPDKPDDSDCYNSNKWDYCDTDKMDFYSNPNRMDYHCNPNKLDYHCNPNRLDHHSNSNRSDQHSHSNRLDQHNNSNRVDQHNNSNRVDQHSHSNRSGQHNNSNRVDPHSHSNRLDRHNNSNRVDQHNNSNRVHQHSHSNRSGLHNNSNRVDPHSHSNRSDQHNNSNRSDQHSNSNRSDQYSNSNRVDPHSHSNRLDHPNDSNRLDHHSNSNRMDHPNDSNRLDHHSNSNRLDHHSNSNRMDYHCSSNRYCSSVQFDYHPKPNEMPYRNPTEVDYNCNSTEMDNDGDSTETCCHSTPNEMAYQCSPTEISYQRSLNEISCQRSLNEMSYNCGPNKMAYHCNVHHGFYPSNKERSCMNQPVAYRCNLNNYRFINNKKNAKPCNSDNQNFNPQVCKQNKKVKHQEETQKKKIKSEDCKESVVIDKDLEYGYDIASSLSTNVGGDKKKFVDYDSSKSNTRMSAGKSGKKNGCYEKCLPVDPCCIEPNFCFHPNALMEVQRNQSNLSCCANYPYVPSLDSLPLTMPLCDFAAYRGRNLIKFPFAPMAVPEAPLSPSCNVLCDDVLREGICMDKTNHCRPGAKLKEFLQKLEKKVQKSIHRCSPEICKLILGEARHPCKCGKDRKINLKIYEDPTDCFEPQPNGHCCPQSYCETEEIRNTSYNSSRNYRSDKPRRNWFWRQRSGKSTIPKKNKKSKEEKKPKNNTILGKSITSMNTTKKKSVDTLVSSSQCSCENICGVTSGSSTKSVRNFRSGNEKRKNNNYWMSSGKSEETCTSRSVSELSDDFTTSKKVDHKDITRNFSRGTCDSKCIKSICKEGNCCTNIKNNNNSGFYKKNQKDNVYRSSSEPVLSDLSINGGGIHSIKKDSTKVMNHPNKSYERNLYDNKPRSRVSEKSAPITQMMNQVRTSTKNIMNELCQVSKSCLNPYVLNSSTVTIESVRNKRGNKTCYLKISGLPNVSSNKLVWAKTKVHCKSDGTQIYEIKQLLDKPPKHMAKK